MKGQNRGRPMAYQTIYSLLYVLTNEPKGLNQIARELAELRGWRSSSKTWVLNCLRRLNQLGLVEQDEKTRKWRIAENKKIWIRQFFFDIRFQDWLIYKLATINPIFTFGPEAGKRFRDVLPPPRNVQEVIRLYGFIQQILLGRICPACIDEGWITRMSSEIGEFGSCRIYKCSRGHVFKIDDEAGTWLEAYIKAMASNIARREAER